MAYREEVYHFAGMVGNDLFSPIPPFQLAEVINSLLKKRISYP